MGSPSVSRFGAKSVLYCPSSCPPREPQPLVAIPTLYLLLTCSLLSLFFIVFSLTRRLLKPFWSEDDDIHSSMELCLSRISERTRLTREENPTRLSESLLVGLLPSNSPKWDALFSSVQEPAVEGSGSGDSDGKRKRKKRGKKKKNNNLNSEDGGELGGEGKEAKGELGLKKPSKEDLVYLYPFTSSSSATQRKIKQQYDQLVKSHESKKLTLVEVVKFVSCLADARTELEQKSEAIQRKFTITKALLLKADRSSFGRIQKQLNRLELEQKRLEEDASVYNLLQHQLKLSPAYKKILDVGASMETKAKSAELTEDSDDSFTDISFEELLAQEKKDSFWQKRGKIRSPPS